MYPTDITPPQYTPPLGSDVEDASVHNHPAYGDRTSLWCEALTRLHGLPSCHRLRNSIEVNP